MWSDPTLGYRNFEDPPDQVAQRQQRIVNELPGTVTVSEKKKLKIGVQEKNGF